MSRSQFQIQIFQVMVIPFVVGMYLAPETPHWYYTQGRDQEGLR